MTRHDWPPPGELPPWLGDDAFHRGHRSASLGKDPDVYALSFPGEPDDLPYVWPTSDRDREGPLPPSDGRPGAAA